MRTCFLCSPEEDLVYWSDGTGLALCGLGPIVKGYSVVSTKEHIRSAADATPDEVPEFLGFALEVRAKLTRFYGQCLLTEHGRVPVCLDTWGMAEPHCYHAHFLMFPAAPDIEATASSYFARSEYASSLEEALHVARRHQEYFLLSHDPQKFVVMTRPGTIMRQFARFLVADALGCSELASWQVRPQRDEAALTAMELRALFKS